MRKYLLSAVALAALASAAQAADEGLTLDGITVYGVVDMGVQYNLHGTSTSDYFPTGTAEVLHKNNGKATFGLAPSNLGQSKIGIKGAEDIVDGLTGIFKLETFFNPQAGTISDARKSQTACNGVTNDPARNCATTNDDSSIAGQMFNSAAYVGLSSPKWGTATFGRQTGLVADGVSKYDPQAASNAFSVIGWSGTAAGGGFTGDRRLDNSLKYLEQFGPVRIGGQYKFGQQTTSNRDAYEFDLGGDYRGASIDAFYMHVNDAVYTNPLTATQFAGLAANCPGCSSDTTLSGTVANTTTYAVMALYDAGKPKAYFGYEHITFTNPTDALPSGTTDFGGYSLAFNNNSPFPIHKALQIVWTGLKYSFTSKFYMTGAWYHLWQNSYATGSNAGCSTSLNGACSGYQDFLSLVADYQLSKRFDAYAGAMWSKYAEGMANDYNHIANIAPTVGIRFTF